MNRFRNNAGWLLPALALCGVIALAAWAHAGASNHPGSPPRTRSRATTRSPRCCSAKETFQAMMAKDKADKAGGHGPAEEAAGGALRPRRRRPDDKLHDDSRQADPGRPGRASCRQGMTWDKLAEMTPDEIRDKGLFPKGFLPLPHPQS